MADHPLLRAISGRLSGLVDVCLPAGVDRGVVVGLSGGPDSVALLLGAAAWGQEAGRPVAAAHLDHGMRGEDSDGDLVFCRDLCGTLDITLFEHAADPRPEANRRGMGVEEAGRHLRRRFFSELLQRHQEFGCIALGHHRDDQAETVIMRMFRGTGPEGLRGIRPVSPPYVRPMLELGRSEIVACLEQVGQPWRTDATNLDGKNLRARIRRELWPVVRGIFGSGAERTPARLAGLMDRDLDFLDRLTDEAFDRACPNGPEGDLDRGVLTALDPALAARVIRRRVASMQPDSLERVHVDSVLEWLAEGQSGTSRDLPGGIRLVREFDRVKIEGPSPNAAPLRAAADYRILVARNGDIGDTQVGEPDDESTWRLNLPADALRGNLQVRNSREGDRFQPFGLDGTKKLSDVLLEKRVPAGDRAGVLLVTDDEGIMWVVGVARAERTRILPTTDRIVTISVAGRADHPKQGM